MVKEGEIEQQKSSLAKKLANACKGLIYISETDAAVVPFVAGHAEETSLKSLQKFIDSDSDVPVEEIDYEHFFDRLTKKRVWHGDNETERAQRFANLKSILDDELTDLIVCKVGRIRIDIFVAGIDENGNLAGIKTFAVET